MKQLCTVGVAILSLGFALAGIGQTQPSSGAPQPGPAVKLDQVVAKDPKVLAASLEKNTLRLDVAEKIGKACLAWGERTNTPVSVFILNQFGDIIYAARMDGQGTANTETALMKAKTALYFRQPTTVWMNRSQDNQLLALLLLQMQQFPNAGGLPIIVEGQLLGSIGVGGAPGGHLDEQCAHEALGVVLGPQPPLTEQRKPPATPR